MSDVAGLRVQSEWCGARLSKEERDSLRAKDPQCLLQYRLQRACCDLMERKACVSCWLQRHCCICAALPAAAPAPSAPRLVLLLHPNEFGRASNTGKLLLRRRPAQPQQQQQLSAQLTFDPASRWSSAVLAARPSWSDSGALLLVSGLPAHEAELRQLWEEDDPSGGSTVVLFPSDDAIDLQSFLRSRSLEGEAKAGAAPLSPPAPRLTVIVLDATFAQAAQLLKRIPARIARVRLDLSAANPEFALFARSLQQRVDSGSVQQAEQAEEEDDQHRRGKQWTAPPTGSLSLSSPSSSSSFAPCAFPSLFTALRRQPQSDRWSTVEAAAFCLQAADGQFRSSLFASLLLLVDAARLQAGLYQTYRTHSRERTREMQRDRLRLFPAQLQQERARERQRERERQSQRRSVAGAAADASLSQPACRAYNRQQGCSRGPGCRHAHRCGHCSGAHPFHACSALAQGERADG